MIQKLTFNFQKKLIQKVIVNFTRNSEQHILDICSNLKVDHAFIIVDSAVEKSIGQYLNKVLVSKMPTHLLTIHAAEKNKNLITLNSIMEKMIIKGISNKSTIIAVGGGLTGNIAGMAASLLFRGIRLVHMPTTLLAQLDSAADVKQSVNCKHVKNAVGALYAPSVVIIDVTKLETLPIREIRSGLAEAIKHALAQDIELLNFINLQVNPMKINIEILEKLIIKTISLKIKHWSNSPNIWNESSMEKTERLTHLGHTIGKVIEILGEDEITHGEAISHGMLIEAMASYKMGIGNKNIVPKMREIFEHFHLLYPLQKKVEIEAIVEHLYGFGGKNNSPLFALLQDIGNPNTVSTTIDRLLLKETLSEYGFE